MVQPLPSLHEEIGTQLKQRVSRHARSYQCRCGNRIFFRNTLCLACRSQLGYLPDEGRMAALDHGASPDAWRVEGRDGVMKSCANRDSAAACNWVMHAADSNAYCIACRLNRTIPNLDDVDNVCYWAKLEIAKRRMVSELLGFGLPLKSKVNEDPDHGLMFDFLRSPPGGPRVLTGHAGGLITMNVEEADDAKREQIKYEHGPPADWASSYVSSYATMHPWEDWAETWAHYLHMVDSFCTAIGFGIDAGNLRCDVEPFTRDALYAPDDPQGEYLLSLLNAWVEIVTVLNEMARSMGEPDFYPFVMCRPVVAKLHFIHMVVADARTRPETAIL
jgi:hypothetical protein